MTDRRTIGRLAKQVGVGVETIRFYEREGLIAQPRKTEGPRHYDDGVLATLRYAMLAKQLGFSLKEIRALKVKLAEGRAFCASLRKMAEEKVASLAREAEENARLQRELTGFLTRCRARDPDLPCPILEELTHLDSAVAGTAAKRRR